MESPSIEVSVLHTIGSEEALAFVDLHLGPSSEWPSPLIAYRLEAEFQADWKEEVGHWLKTAERLGFLDRVLHDVRTQAKQPSRSATIDANDARHLKLNQHLAAARMIHYMVGTGWSFNAYEPESGEGIDIDAALRAPDGTRTEFQVKAPDQPGNVVSHKKVGGEFDNRVTLAIDHACRQLRRPATGPAFVAVCANRDLLLAAHPRCLVTHLMGSTSGTDSGVYLLRRDVGRFFEASWDHVSGVVALDLLRGASVTKYTCTVFLNPSASYPASPAWFPYARVCLLDKSIFRWVRGEPDSATTLPAGTRLVDEFPERSSGPKRTS